MGLWVCKDIWGTILHNVPWGPVHLYRFGGADVGCEFSHFGAEFFLEFPVALNLFYRLFCRLVL